VPCYVQCRGALCQFTQALPCPALPCPALPCHSLACPTLKHPDPPCTTAYSALPCPGPQVIERWVASHTSEEVMAAMNAARVSLSSAFFCSWAALELLLGCCVWLAEEVMSFWLVLSCCLLLAAAWLVLGCSYGVGDAGMRLQPLSDAPVWLTFLCCLLFCLPPPPDCRCQRGPS